AEAALKAWGMRDSERAYDSLRRILASMTPPEFGPLLENISQNIDQNADAVRALNNLERFNEVAIGLLAPAALAHERPYLFSLLFELFGFSQFLSDVVIRYPHYAVWLGLPET